MNDATSTAESVLAWIADHWTTNGYGPTVREVQRQFGWRSTAGAEYHLRRLRDAGHITWQPRQARSIQPTKGAT
jgi:SOS-response transcriptional repressor LexA